VDAPFPSYDGENEFVFVCYSHADHEIVYSEIGWLKDQAVNIWYDEGILAGKNWRAETGSSLDGATWVLFFISKASLESDHCNREINLALDEGKEIIPVYLEDIALTPDLKIGLNRIQAIHREQQSLDTYRSNLLSALGSRTGNVSLTAGDQQGHNVGKRRLQHLMLGAVVTVALISMVIWKLFESPSENVQGQIPTDLKPYVLVVPFDVSATGDEPWGKPFADQVTREIIRNLRKVSGLRTVPAPSAFAFGADKTRPHIRAQLPDVRYVLDGLISIGSEKNMRISLALEDLNDGRILWDDEHFIRDDDIDLFGVQSDVARSVSASLKVAVLDGEERKLDELPTENLAAYSFYVEGLGFQNRSTNEALIQSIERFDAALRLDPEFVLAHVAKAKSYRQRMTFFEPPIDMLSYVSVAATDAIALDQDSAEARSALGMAYLQSWHFDDAWRYLSDAKSRDATIGVTHLGLALYYTALGDERHAFDSLTTAEDHDPLNPEIAALALFIHLLFEEFETGLELAEEKVRLFPGVPLVASNASWLFSLGNDHERAVSLAEQGVRLSQRAPFFLIGLAQVYAQAGREDDAREVLHEAEQSESYVCPYETAIVYIFLDDIESAFDLLDHSVDYRSNCLMFTRQDPRLEPIRDDPRYTTLLNTVRLDDLSVGKYSR
jgi:TolB-like protein/tetratricopeptide (TPR) repeat protein